MPDLLEIAVRNKYFRTILSLSGICAFISLNPKLNYVNNTIRPRYFYVRILTRKINFFIGSSISNTSFALIKMDPQKLMTVICMFI